jgi:hypothetical protein
MTKSIILKLQELPMLIHTKVSKINRKTQCKKERKTQQMNVYIQKETD